MVLTGLQPAFEFATRYAEIAHATADINKNVMILPVASK